MFFSKKIKGTITDFTFMELTKPLTYSKNAIIANAEFALAIQSISVEYDETVKLAAERKKVNYLALYTLLHSILSIVALGCFAFPRPYNLLGILLAIILPLCVFQWLIWWKDFDNLLQHRETFFEELAQVEAKDLLDDNLRYIRQFLPDCAEKTVVIDDILPGSSKYCLSLTVEQLLAKLRLWNENTPFVLCQYRK